MKPDTIKTGGLPDIRGGIISLLLIALAMTGLWIDIEWIRDSAYAIVFPGVDEDLQTTLCILYGVACLVTLAIGLRIGYVAKFGRGVNKSDNNHSEDHDEQ